MSYETVTSQKGLREFCKVLADSSSIEFDTEFVSEHSYRPQLCLVQVACGGKLTVIDPFEAGDLTPFWEALVAEGHETIVHAGRQELEFCLDAVGKRPTRLFDVQIAAAFIGLEYPASYGNLLIKVLGVTPQKGETRTDWRRRPLSGRQIDYALDDVRHLRALRDKLAGRIAELGRASWLDAEMTAWQDEVQAARTRERWRRVSGTSGLSSRSLAILRELWQWREGEAERRDCPPKRVLRDDLLAEIAKRRTDDPKRIRAVRGMERGDIARMIPDMARAVTQALELPDKDCPPVIRREHVVTATMLSQFLSSALSSICHAAEVAPSLVGTASDVRELVIYHLEQDKKKSRPLPALMCGWRSEVVGQLLHELLAGEAAIRIVDPASDHPLAIDPLPPAS